MYVTHNSELRIFSSQATRQLFSIVQLQLLLLRVSLPLYISPLPFNSLFSGDTGEKWKYAV